jgi:hypothetical protein
MHTKTAVTKATILFRMFFVLHASRLDVVCNLTVPELLKSPLRTSTS